MIDEKKALEEMESQALEAFNCGNFQLAQDILHRIAEIKTGWRISITKDSVEYVKIDDEITNNVI